jgi:hypothetical protein
VRLDPNQFLHSLCKFLVTQAAALSLAVTLAYAPASGNADLWYNFGKEEFSNDPYSVLRTYPGPPLDWGHMSDKLNVQVETVGSSDAAALARAQAIFECFTSLDGLPLRMKTFTAYDVDTNTANGIFLLVAALPLQRPGLIGRDERDRAQIVFNLELWMNKIA